jgi:hypothetical protein
MSRYRVNVALVTNHRRRAARYPSGCPLSEDKVEEYKQMHVLYEDVGRQVRGTERLRALTLTLAFDLVETDWVSQCL